MDSSIERKEAKEFPLAAKVLASGLILCQIIATLHVYLSNLGLHEKSRQIMDSGYTSVPNAKTFHLLEQFNTAFFGGVFFTLTLGCFLTLAAFSYAWTWRRFFFHKKSFLIPGAALWAACLWMVNSRGLQIMASSYFLLIPPGVFAVTLHLMRKDLRPFDTRRFFLHFAPFILLAAQGFFQMDSGLFIQFRDHVLLSNPAGMKINDFYYRYTLFPAEVFKSFDQKLIRTCHVSDPTYGINEIKLKNALVLQDCLPVANQNADLNVLAKKNHLIFSFQGKEILTADRRAFLGDPAKYLAAYSSQTDAFGFFRNITFISLLVGLPVSVYILVFSFILFGCSRVVNENVASMVSSVFCLAAGIAILLLLQEGRKPMDQKDVAGMILSEERVERTRAIRRVMRLKQDVMTYPVSETHLESSYIPERYWLAMALGRSRSPKALDYLSRLAEDPQVNVRCQAYAALSRRRNKAFIPLIYDKLAKSDHVYEQLYAYRALKDLGWNQSK